MICWTWSPWLASIFCFCLPAYLPSPPTTFHEGRGSQRERRPEARAASRCSGLNADVFCLGHHAHLPMLVQHLQMLLDSVSTFPLLDNISGWVLCLHATAVATTHSFVMPHLSHCPWTVNSSGTHKARCNTWLKKGAQCSLRTCKGLNRGFQN